MALGLVTRGLVRRLTVVLGLAGAASGAALTSVAAEDAGRATGGTSKAGDLAGPAVREKVRAYRVAHEVGILREFVELLSLPNLASDRPNILRNAGHIVGMLKRRGFATRLLEAEGAPPAVYGELASPGARRTILVYAHYDGQPVDRSQWASDPWVPVLRQGSGTARELSLEGLSGPLDGESRLYARSAGDDKAPVIGLLTALDALRAARIPLSVNLKVFFEGEEEAGSPHLPAVLERHADLLKADAWLLCDGPVHQTRRMQVFYGARGITDLELSVYGPIKALHSGHYGNWAPNPGLILAHLLADLRDPDGRILVAGFADDVRPLSQREREALSKAPAADEALRREFALASTEAGNAPLLERIMLPALNLRGIEVGRVGARAANAIPTEATASIDFRLVPDQTPQKVRDRVEAHLRGRGWTVVHETPDAEERRVQPRLVKLEWGPGYPPARTSMELPVARAIVRAIEEATGGPIVELPTLGGSVPMQLFAEATGAPIIGVPIANHDNNQHAANENLRLQNLWDGIEIYGGLLARLGVLLDQGDRRR